MASPIGIDDWRDADSKWVDAPPTSHVKRFRPVFFKAGRHTLEVQFKGSKSNPKEPTYRYWQKSDDAGLAAVVNVWNALIQAPHPGEIIDAWLKKGGWPYARI